MKKLKYLIPLFVLASCASSVEVYDDVYTKVKTVGAYPVNEDLGYADYIKGSESNYVVEIDSSDHGANQMGEGYYTNSGDIIVNNYSSPNSNGFGPSNNFYYNSWGPNYYNPYGNWGGYYGGLNNYYGWNNGFYGGWGNNCWNNGFYGGWGNNYWNNGFYGNPYWGYNNYWNGYNNGYWNGYNNGFNNGWYSNNWSNDGNGSGAGFGGSNHIYGHRGSVSSNSPNTTAYDHTVKAPVQGGGATSGSGIIKPFEVYSNETADVTAGLGIGQKVNGGNGASYLSGSVNGASGNVPAEPSRLNGVSNNVSNAGGAAVDNGSSTLNNSGGIINGNVKEPVKAGNTAFFSGGATTNSNVNGGAWNTAGVAASNQNASTTSTTATNKFASTGSSRPSNVTTTVGGGTKYPSANAGSTNPSQANTTDRSVGTSRTVATGGSSTTSGSNRTTTTTTNTNSNTRTNTGGSTYGNRTTSSGSSSGGSSRSGSSGGGSSSGGSSRR